LIAIPLLLRRASRSSPDADRASADPHGVVRQDDVGVAILAYGRSDDHAELLRDLRTASVADERIIIVHNPDGPGDDWRPASPGRSTLISMSRNVGYAAAMNQAISAFADRGMRAVVVFTHDARIDEFSLTKMLAAANAAPHYGVLGFAIRGAGGASISYGSAMGRDGIVRHRTDRPAGEVVADAMFVDGSALFLRLVACGRRPMPERYFMYFEEAELCSQVRDRGWGVGIALDAVASSVSGIKHRRAAFQYLYIRNGLDWAIRHEGVGAALLFTSYELRRAWADTPKPGGRRFRDPTSRRAGYEQLRVRLLGFADFLRRRWGPPPPWLRQVSDIRYVD
jgi:GT2 family glycosyltransferase